MGANRANGDQPVRVLGIGGSMRQASLSGGLLRATLAMADAAGAETMLADVRELNLPVYNPDLPLTGYPPAMAWLVEQARAADAFIFCSPTYHGTVNGAVKNALDALDLLAGDTPRYLGGKPVGLVALGGGSASNVITALGHAARGLNALAIPLAVTASGGVIDLERLEITDDGPRDRLGRMVRELISITRRLRASERVVSRESKRRIVPWPPLMSRPRAKPGRRPRPGPSPQSWCGSGREPRSMG